MKKICLIASGGGHLEQIKQLKDVMDKNDCFFVMTKTNVNTNIKNRTYYINDKPEGNILKKIWILILLTIQSLKILIKENPNVVISTGAGNTIPFCYLAKGFGKKIIYIESFARIQTPNKTGKVMYPIADVFIIQWKELQKYYPKAIYGGWIY